MDPELKAEFNRLHTKIDRLNKMVSHMRKEKMKQETKATWVPVSWVLEVTGWTRRKLQAAREQNIVEYKKSQGGGYLYKLESTPEIFIKHKH